MELSIDELGLLRLVVFYGVVGDASELIGFAPEKRDETLEALVVMGLIVSDGLVTATPAGMAALESWYATDRQYVAPAEQQDLLDDFKPLDRQVKRLASAWQNAVEQDNWDLRLKCVEDLQSHHEAASEYLERATTIIHRFENFKVRLDSTMNRILDGEMDYFVGVRCDSYHTVWFQLHEDLLRLFQKQREDDD